MSNKVNLKFNQNENILKAENNHIVSLFNDGAKPYDLLLGALGSCFYATFVSITEKKRLTFGEVTLQITGTKRSTVPTTLEHVTIDMTIINPSNEEQIKKSAILGAKYCSIHDMISKVANIDLNISFK